jgi:RimJ/RimL family protein N-acetyltransferase
MSAVQSNAKAREKVAIGLAPAGRASVQSSKSLGPQPLVRTGRLTLRRPAATDAAAIAAAIGSYNVARMLTRVPLPYHVDDAVEWLSGLEGGEAGDWVFAITLGGLGAMRRPGDHAANGNEADRLIGVVSVEGRSAEGRYGFHLGYWLDEAHWGRGIMTEAANAVIARFFSAHLGETLLSGVIADNPASLKIQGRLGFAITGVAEAYCLARAKMAQIIQTELTFGGYMPM